MLTDSYNSLKRQQKALFQFLFNQKTQSPLKTNVDS